MKEFSVAIQPGYDFLYVCDRNLDVATRELMKPAMRSYLQRMRQRGTAQPVHKGQTVIPISGYSCWVAVEVMEIKSHVVTARDGAGDTLQIPLENVFTQEDAGAAFSAVESLFSKI